MIRASDGSVGPRGREHCANKAEMSERAAEPSDTRQSLLTDPRRFMRVLVGVTLAALALRVAYVVISRQDISFGGDAFFYHGGANLLADGHGFVEPYSYLTGHIVQAADHPPLYLLYLAIPSLVGMTSTLTHLLWSCLLGAATVLVVGLIGRHVGTPRIGVIAAVVAGLYPNLWVADGSLQAETAAMFTTALTVLLAYRYLQRPCLLRLVAVGVASGAAALARSELILLVPFVVIPLVCSTDTVSWRHKVRWLGAAVVAALVVIGPWVGYNIARFRHPVYLSSQYPSLLSAANCDTTYYGSLLGYYSVACIANAERQSHAAGDQSQTGIAFQRSASNYIRHHLGRLPVVVAARLGRIFEVYRPAQNLSLREYLDGAEKSVARAALIGFYLLASLSVVGGVLLRRRRAQVFPLLAPIVVVLITVVVTYGNPRFRTAAEVMLAVLGAVAIDAVASRRPVLRGRGARSDPTVVGTGDDETGATTGPRPAVE